MTNNAAASRSVLRFGSRFDGTSWNRLWNHRTGTQATVSEMPVFVPQVWQLAVPMIDADAVETAHVATAVPAAAAAAAAVPMRVQRQRRRQRTRAARTLAAAGRMAK